MKEFKLIVIGGGAAGFSAVIEADKRGSKTLLVDDSVLGLGGTCVNVGCLPTKYLLNLTQKIHDSKNNNFNGMTFSTSFDFKTIMNEKTKLTRNLRREKYVNVLKGLKNVELIKGKASFISKNEIKVGNQVFKSEKFIVATGSRTFIPNIVGLGDIGFIDHISALNLKKVPENLVIIGGGPVGVEFSQIFSRFGSKVTLIHSGEHLLNFAEPELAQELKSLLVKEGIQVFINASVEGFEKRKDKKVVQIRVGNKTRKLVFDEVFLSTGRIANTSGLNVEEIFNIKLDRKKNLIVDKYLKVKDNLYAAGDVKGYPMLETIAAKEAKFAAINALSNEKKKLDYSVFPSAVFTDPSYASVGLTQKQLEKKGIAFESRVVNLSYVPKAITIKKTQGMIKILVDKVSKKVLGIHLLSHQAEDIIQSAVFIIRNKMTVSDVIDTIFVFPTMTEILKIGMQSFKRDIEHMSCCVD